MRYVEALNEWDGEGVSLFIAGGISNCSDWQSEMAPLLSDTELVLLNPRRKNFPMEDPFAAPIQIKWEHKYLAYPHAVLFWFPPETLCPITLFELGTFARTDIPVFVGVDPNYARKLDIEVQMSLWRPDIKVVYSLVDLANQVKQWEKDNGDGRHHPGPETIACGQSNSPLETGQRACCGNGDCCASSGGVRGILDSFKRLFNS